MKGHWWPISLAFATVFSAAVLIWGGVAIWPPPKELVPTFIAVVVAVIWGIYNAWVGYYLVDKGSAKIVVVARADTRLVFDVRNMGGTDAFLKRVELKINAEPDGSLRPHSTIQSNTINFSKGQTKLVPNASLSVWYWPNSEQYIRGYGVYQFEVELESGERIITPIAEKALLADYKRAPKDKWKRALFDGVKYAYSDCRSPQANAFGEIEHPEIER